jgi:predicted metal-dependent hydrolase
MTDDFQADDSEISTRHAYDQRYLQGIGYFNECDFFEAHEIWEELWTEYRGEARKYYQGLIQVAVALHHFGNGNIRGAKKVYLTSRGYLQEYPTTYEGLDLETFLSQYERCFAEILNNEDEYPQIDIDADLIPEIHLLNQPTKHP